MSKMSALTSARPPTSSHDTFGILGAPIFWLYVDRASSMAISKSAFVRDSPAEKMSFGATPSPLRVWVSHVENRLQALYHRHTPLV